jgi:hypothetical protein
MLIAAGRHRPEAESRRYPARLWRAFDSKYPGFAPAWWQSLTTTHALGGAEFEYPLDPTNPWLGYCVIPGARKYWRLHNDHFYIHQLQDSRLFPFGDAGDGNWWLFETTGSDDPHVHLLELPAWDGTVFTADNGLHSPGAKLSQFFEAGARWQPRNNRYELHPKTRNA